MNEFLTFDDNDNANDDNAMKDEILNYIKLVNYANSSLVPSKYQNDNNKLMNIF